VQCAAAPGDLNGLRVIVVPGVGHYAATTALAPWRP
jgi:hypothetical protein